MLPSAVMEGLWYLPGKEDLMIPGNLQRTETGKLRLRLSGWFRAEDPTGAFAHYPDIILGHTFEHGLVTLVDCFLEVGPVSGLVNNQRRTLYADYGMLEAHLGANIEQRNDITTDRIVADFTNNKLWKAPRPRSLLAQDLNKWGSRDCSVNVTPPKNRVVYRGSDFSVVYIEQVRSKTFESETYFGLHPSLEIRSSRTRHLDDFRMLLIAIESYLSFICRVRIRRCSLTYRHPSKQRLRQWIEVEGEFNNLDKNEISRFNDSIYKADRLFHLGDVYREFKNSIKVWLDNFEEFFPVYLLYLNSMEVETTVDQSVFSLAQSCEALYRRIENNGKHLDKIVREMAQKTHPRIQNHIGNPIEFGTKIKDIRHYYAHYDHRKKTFPFTMEELTSGRKDLRLVLEIYMMRWMGIPARRVEEIIGRVWEYGHLGHP